MAGSHFDVGGEAAYRDGASVRAGDGVSIVAAGVDGAPSAEPEGPPSYRAMMFGADGRMVLQTTIAARDDDDAKAQALALVDGHSVDLWDQLRFIDRFEADPVPAPVRDPTARSSHRPGANRAGMRLRPNEDL